MNKNKKIDTVKIFKQLVKNRRAWRRLETTLIKKDIINEILSYAKYCPSSFGLEPWKIVVVSNKEIKEQLLPYCDNQAQAVNNSHLLIILAHKKEMFLKNNPWMVNQVMTNRDYTSEVQFKDFYFNKFLPFMKKIENWDEWSIRQSYILLESLLLAATANNIGSSPMEGVDNIGIVNFLEKNNYIKLSKSDSFICPYIIALGYKDENYKIKDKKVKAVSEKYIFLE